MDFPVTVDSQEDFDDLIKPRLEREKTKRVDLQKQVDSLTAEKQELTTKVTDFESRATAAEQWKNERETADALNETRSAVAKEFGVAVEALRGADEDVRDFSRVGLPIRRLELDHIFADADRGDRLHQLAEALGHAGQRAPRQPACGVALKAP